MILYFVPSADGAAFNPEKHGLGYAFDGPPTVAADVTLRGVRGVLATQQGDGERLQIDEAVQEWHGIPGGDCRVGWWDDDRPTPESLLKAGRFGGEFVRMADGNEWLVPKLRVYSSETNGLVTTLPCRVGVDENGDWVANGPTPEFAELDRIAGRLVEHAISTALPGEEQPMTATERLDAVETLLGLNYRVRRAELTALGVLAMDNTLRDLVRTACDLPAVEAGEPKKSTPSAG